MDQVKDLMTTNVVTIRTVHHNGLEGSHQNADVSGQVQADTRCERGDSCRDRHDRTSGRQALNSPVVIRERSADEYLLDSVTVGSSMTNNPLDHKS